MAGAADPGEPSGQDETTDVIGVTKGKGYKEFTKKLQHQTQLGLCRVTCTEEWHPALGAFSMVWARQEGYHQCTEINKIYKIGQGYPAVDSRPIKNTLHPPRPVRQGHRSSGWLCALQ